MTELQFELSPVDEFPVKKRRGGPGGAGRVSPYSEILDQIRATPNQAFKITAQPLDAEGGNVKAASAARRIHEGLIKGVQAGEFEAEGADGHVYVKYVGQSGIDEWAAGEPERERRKQAKAEAKAAKAAAKLDAANDEQATDSSVTDPGRSGVAETPGVTFSDSASGW